MESEGMRPAGLGGMSAPKKAALLIGLGGVVLIVGPLLPFLTDDFGGSLGGLDTDDGKVFLGFGVALLVLAGAIWAIGSATGRRVVAALATLGALFMLYAAIVDITDDLPEGISVGIGLYVTLIGTIVASVGAVWALFAKEPAAEVAPPPPPPAG